jgi:hypothetical protein
LAGLGVAHRAASLGAFALFVESVIAVCVGVGLHDKEKAILMPFLRESFFLQRSIVFLFSRVILISLLQPCACFAVFAAVLDCAQMMLLAIDYGICSGIYANYLLP